MVHRQHFTHKIRELGYTYKGRKRRVHAWRKRGGSHFIMMPTNDMLEDEFVISALRQAGCDTAEINDFLRCAKS
jgi:hypothetical protein